MWLAPHRPLSRRLDRCDRMIQNESRDPFGGNVHYVTMQITFLTRKFRNGERNLHCDVVHINTKWVSSLTLDCNGVFAIKAYSCTFKMLQTSHTDECQVSGFVIIPDMSYGKCPFCLRSCVLSDGADSLKEIGGKLQLNMKHTHQIQTHIFVYKYTISTLCMQTMLCGMSATFNLWWYSMGSRERMRFHSASGGKLLSKPQP